LIFWLCFVELSASEAAPQGLRFVEAVIGLVISTTQAASGSPGRGLVIEISRPFRLFCGNTPETHALVGKKDCGASKEKLSELEDWVKTPSLEEQNSSAEKADGCKKRRRNRGPALA